MNHYTTNIQMYKLDKLTEIEWEKLNINLMLEPWDKVTTMGADELQTRITTNLENAVMKTAELRSNPKKTKTPTSNQEMSQNQKEDIQKNQEFKQKPLIQ